MAIDRDHNPAASPSINTYIQSPTGNTWALADQLKAHLIHLCEVDNLTPPVPLTLVGVPVYAGRVPNLMLPWLRAIEGLGGPVVALVTYGGRHFDDALIELADGLKAQNFVVIGAGAFVASHSFSPDLIPNRPNSADDGAILDFARQILAQWLSFTPESPSLDLEMMGLGQRPYRPYLQPLDAAGLPIPFTKIKPAVDHSLCTRCGACVPACPLGSIPLSDPTTTPGKCTKCNACVKVCPEGARFFIDLGYLWHLNELKTLCDGQAPNVYTVGIEFRPFNLPEDVGKLEAWIRSHYWEDPHFLDYVTPLVKELYQKRSQFSKHCHLQGFWLYEPQGTLPLGTVTFLEHKAYRQVLQVVFMEYVDQQAISYAIVAEANRYAKAMGQWRITFGLSGHVNYGLGLSVANEKRPSFGAPYSKAYYAKHLAFVGRGIPGWLEKGISTYHYPWSAAGFPMPQLLTDRLERKSQGKLTWRAAKVHRFAFSQSDMAIYTMLNNACFTRHDFYFPRDPKEDLELFGDLRHFMVPGSLIFAYYDNMPVGFLLWYPDWSEWMKGGETLGLGTYLKVMAKGIIKKPQGFKIVEWAVLPEHSKKGIPIMLLKACEAIIGPYHFSEMLTSWILDENKNSNTFAKHWAKPHEHYKAFRFDRT